MASGFKGFFMKTTAAQIEYLKVQCLNINSIEDLSALLTKAKTILYGKECTPIESKTLMHFANPSLFVNRYKEFIIKKKSGNDRLIHAPVKQLKSILKPLSLILNCVYEPPSAATGFVVNKSIVDNARNHVSNKSVYNIDLKNFFHSFDRNRVKLGFMYAPFNFNGKREPLAYFLSCLCTHTIEINGEKRTILPQGSPTSPVITNILCRKLDHRLSGLARRFGANYSRYADDITFSSQKYIFKNKKFIIELNRIIVDDQRLTVNPQKTRCQNTGFRQEVTGLIINEKLNVRKRYVKKIRMWLYYWEKYGYDKAESIFRRDYIRDKGYIKNGNASMIYVINGKLEFLKMVLGHENLRYKKLRHRLSQLILMEVKKKKGESPTYSAFH